MTCEDAIRRIVDIGRTMKIETENDERNYIALEMAINSLQWAQHDGNIGEDKETAKECSNLNAAIGEAMVNGLGMPPDNGKKSADITISDLAIMAEYADKHQVEVEFEITPEEQRMTVSPWKPTRMTTRYE